MRGLPTGTVTFLFTDIEGSTRLLRELGDSYIDALADHRRLLREAFARHGGVEVDTQGDAFFVAFASAAEAVGAAADAQAALDGGPVRVRMGLHTGTPELGGEGYVGLDVHLGARVAAAGHGGQVLLSQATRNEVDAEVVDLGEHRLKDFSDPVWIFQLPSEERFPPLKTISNTNLPRPASTFVGRERERAEVVSLVREGVRLATLTGPGGSGKTRLAIEAAGELIPEFRNGVFWVGLAPLHDPALVLDAVAQMLGAKDGLVEHIGERELLLLLDNLEQVIDTAPELASLLEACPNLRLLVTSRELLRVRGEVEYAVLPLADPDAIELFCSRSGRAADDAVEELCRRLDNLPLAIELAAARASVLSPRQLLERLSQRLDLLRGGRDADARQQTLRATIAWSHDLLDERERLLFARLAVFVGGCTLAAAEEVAGADLDTLQSLVEKSLVRRTGERFWMLETIREYAAERFEQDPDADALRCRHAEHTVRVAENAKARHHEGYGVLEVEHDNARVALDFLCAAGEAELALRLVVAFGDYWFVRGHAREGRRRSEEALALPGLAAGDLRLAALSRASDLARLVGDADSAASHGSAAVRLARELGDVSGLVVALCALGDALVVRGDYDRGVSIYEEALVLARETGQSPVQILTNLADAVLGAGEAERAIEYSTQAAELAEGHDRETVRAIAAFNIGSALVQLGRVDDARAHVRESLEAVLRLEYPELLAWCLTAAAAVAARSEGRDAARLVGAADALMDAGGVEFGPAEQRLRGLVLSELRERHTNGEVEELVQSGRAVGVEGAVALARQYLD
jgi:predicted ATPase/class 3 adenylate cyclase